jgi:hypothetical protein
VCQRARSSSVTCSSSADDVVAGDARVLESAGLATDESALTGEPVTAAKGPEAVLQGQPSADPRDDGRRCRRRAFVAPPRAPANDPREAIGGIAVVLTDKTGTLTENRRHVNASWVTVSVGSASSALPSACSTSAGSRRSSGRKQTGGRTRGGRGARRGGRRANEEITNHGCRRRRARSVGLTGVSAAFDVTTLDLTACGRFRPRAACDSRSRLPAHARHFTLQPRARVSGSATGRPASTASSAPRSQPAFCDGSWWSASGAPR